MSLFNSRDLLKAARLTKAGRLVEATAMLREGLLGSGSTAAPPSQARRRTPSPASDTKVRPAADLGAMLSVLDRLKSGRPGPVERRTVPLPAGARFEDRVHAGPAGTRPYKIYVPASAVAGRALPLVVMLHGCTQDPDDFALGTRMNEVAEENAFLVAYPAQTGAANSSRCWNWFGAANQRRDTGEAAIVAAITREVMAGFDVDPGRVYAAGLSAGGAAAAILGQVYPELYAAVGVHSGLACGAARDMPSAFAAMREGGAPPRGPAAGPVVPTIVFHGDGDKTVHPVNGEHVIAQVSRDAAGLSATVSEGTAPGGIAYTRTRRSRGSALVSEQWVLHGAGHAWSGGSAAGSYVEPRGPDASREMVRFFREVSAAGQA